MLRSFLLRITPRVVPGALIVAALGLGCRGRVYVIDEGPPPARSELVVYRPGHIWVQGHWERRGRTWYWREGHYERERPNMVYVAGHWERRGHRYVWVDGAWRERRGVVIRETRRF